MQLPAICTLASHWDSYHYPKVIKPMWISCLTQITFTWNSDYSYNHAPFEVLTSWVWLRACEMRWDWLDLRGSGVMGTWTDGSHQSQSSTPPLFLLTSRNPWGASLLWSSQLFWEACVQLWFPLISLSSYSSSSVIDIHTWATCSKDKKTGRWGSHLIHGFLFPADFVFLQNTKLFFSVCTLLFTHLGFLYTLRNGYKQYKAEVLVYLVLKYLVLEFGKPA